MNKEGSAVVSSPKIQRDRMEHASTGVATVWDGPLCFAMKEWLDSIPHKPNLTKAEKDEALKLIQQPQPCDSFTKWQIGLTPQEHLNMHMLEEQRRSNKEWLERQEARNRRFTSRHRQIDRLFQKKIANESRVNALVCSAIGIGAALAGTLGGSWLVYYFTP